MTTYIDFAAVRLAESGMTDTVIALIAVMAVGFAVASYLFPEA